MCLGVGSLGAPLSNAVCVCVFRCLFLDSIPKTVDRGRGQNTPGVISGNYRKKMTRYGLVQIEYAGHKFNRQLQRGPIEYYRCGQYKLGCKARFSMRDGVAKAGATLVHNHA